MNRARSVIVLLALAVASCAPSIESPLQAAQRVNELSQWVEEAHRCPGDVMPVSARERALQDRSCAGDGAGRCFARCRDGDVDSCYWLAVEMQRADIDEPAAQVLFQRACALGEPSACTNRAAGLLDDRHDDIAALRCAMSTFRKSCQVSDAWGCTMLGRGLHDGLGVEKNDARALEVLGKSCVNGANDPACVSAKALIEKIKSGTDSSTHD